MKEYQYTDFAINHANKEAIVYRFANGETREITVADFGGNEDEFRKWKELSDNDLYEENNHMRRISRKDVSINGLDETDLARLPSMEELLVDRENNNDFIDAMSQFLKLLTDTQKRRLYLYAFSKMSYREIARCEGVDHKQICRCFTNILNKLKKFEKDMPQNGKKMAVSERINSLRVLIEKHWKRIDAENQ